MKRKQKVTVTKKIGQRFLLTWFHIEIIVVLPLPLWSTHSKMAIPGYKAYILL